MASGAGDGIDGIKKFYLDVLVQFAPGAKTYERFLTLSELLEARLERRVELVTTESLSPYIGPRILAEAQDVLRAA